MNFEAGFLRTFFGLVAGFVLCVSCFCVSAHAAGSLDAWRSDVLRVRQLAENDAPLAYKDTLRLQANFPADATPVDKVRVLNLLSRIEIYLVQIEQAVKHAQQAMELAKQNGDRVGQAEADINLALNPINEVKIDDQFAAAINSLEVLHEIDRPDLLVEAMLRVIMMDRRTSRVVDSINMSKQAMEIARRNNTHLVMAYAYQGQAITYDQNGRYSEAREQYLLMLEQARAVPSKLLEADALLGLGGLANNLGDIRVGEKYIREAMGLYRLVSGDLYASGRASVLAHNLLLHDHPASALPFSDEAVVTYQHYGNKMGLWLSLNVRSQIHQALGHFAAAKADAERSYLLAKEFGLSSCIIESAKRLSSVASARGDYRQAYRFNMEAADVAARVERERVNTRMITVAKRDQMENTQQRQIDELTRRNEQQSIEKHWLWTVIVGSILLLSITVFFLQRLRHAHRLLKTSNTQLLQSQEEVRLLNVDLEQRVQARVDELRQQTRYLRTLINTLPLSVWLKDTESRFLVVNSTTAATSSQERTGYTAEQMIGKTEEELWPGGHSQAFRFTDLEVMETRQRKTFVVHIPGADGTVVWMEIDKAPVIDEDGSVLGTVGVAHDVSEHKRYEQALLKQAKLEQRMRLFFERQLVGMAITSPEKGWVEVNDKICEMLGYSREELARLTWAELTYPEDLASDVAQFERMQRGEIDGYMLEKRFVHKEGRIVFSKLAVACVRRGDQSVDYVLAMLVDITERKLMEEKLIKREQEFRALVENSPDTIARYDSECRRIYINPAFARLGAKSADAMLEVTPANYYSLPEATGYENALRHVLESGEEGEYELTWPDCSGRLITSHIHIIPEWGVGGGVVSVLAIGRDITELKRYEAEREAALIEAKRLARSRGEFLAQMSHELRTPLNGILGYAQILGRDKKLDERQLAGVNVIRQSGEHLLTLINDILDLAKIDAGKIEINPGDIQLDKFLRTIVRILRIKADNKHLEFLCILAANIPAWVSLDEKRLRQVLLNLLSNAVKFTERGRVTLRLDFLPSGRLRFEVEDTGMGIKADQLETIFQPFEQVGDEQHRYSGTGLGLPISRQLVRLMGGDIYVSSKPGLGSTFWFELDARVAGLDVVVLPHSVVTGYAGGRKTILVVDDVNENRALAVQMLGPLGFTLIEAENGREALEKMQNFRPDLILMDSIMPVMDGLEATRQLRQIPGFESLPVIAVSASTSDENEAHCLQSGANVFLPRPIDLALLLVHIAALLELDWCYEQDEIFGEVPVVPPLPEMEILHHLALSGNMREILQRVDNLIEMDEGYRPFAEQLRNLALGYQSRALLKFVENYL